MKSIRFLIFLFCALALLLLLDVPPSESSRTFFSIPFNEQTTLPSQAIILSDEPYTLEVVPRTHSFNGTVVPLLTYNGQLPGPRLQVQQGANHTIIVRNTMPYETTVHWHGLRLNHSFDGVPDVTQKPIRSGESFTYELTFPDAGIFWYHPHIREDYQQESGLYGMIEVRSPDAPLYQPVVLDDIALDANGTVPFYQEVITHAIMGRYGTQYLINGQEKLNLSHTTSQPLYLAFLNVANVRPFRITIPGAKMTLLEGDIGPLEQVQPVDSFVLAPAERTVISVAFPSPGNYTVFNDNPLQRTALGTLTVTQKTSQQAMQEQSTSGLSALASRYLSSPPNHTLNLGLELEGMGHLDMMHSDENIEWEDTMPGMAHITNETVRWTITDAQTKKQNMGLHYRWPLGSYQKIRLVNSLESPHPMQHPIHFHGQRFLVLSTNGIPTETLGWKDTVLVRMGDTVDILLEVSNPGAWMIHCHIPEHLQSGMMASFSAGDLPKRGITHAN